MPSQWTKLLPTWLPREAGLDAGHPQPVAPVTRVSCPLIAALGSRHRVGNVSLITAGQAGGTGPGRGHWNTEVL